MCGERVNPQGGLGFHQRVARAWNPQGGLGFHQRVVREWIGVRYWTACRKKEAVPLESSLSRKVQCQVVHLELSVSRKVDYQGTAKLSLSRKVDYQVVPQCCVSRKVDYQGTAKLLLSRKVDYQVVPLELPLSTCRLSSCTT